MSTFPWKSLKPELSNRLILFLILSCAAVLRFYHYGNVPFTHDEFSALFRLRFDSFTELIEKGVKVDGHPAGIQVFLYYYTRIFGESARVVKLPFTLAGLLSVILIFRLGEKWFSGTTGLLSAAYLASIELMVMYSQIARPYISGLFFILGMAWQLTLLINEPEQRPWLRRILFIVFAALASYNHHFSLLLAAIIGCSGFFYIPRKQRPWYILSGLVIFLLYLPHIGVFIYQLKMGGVGGWLARPQYSFFPDYVRYIFNFSWFSLLLAASLFLYGLRKDRFHKPDGKIYLLFATWFLLPLLIGFFYSRYVNAVLQFSVLIFSTPFLFLLLFGHIKEQGSKINLLLVAAVLLVNILSLTLERQYYRIFYNPVYKGILLDAATVKSDDPSALLLVDNNRKISRYYALNEGMDTSFIWYDSFKDIGEFKTFLEEQAPFHQKLFLGSLSFIDPEVCPLVREFYPGILWQHSYFTGTSYLFTKEGGAPVKAIGKLDFESLPEEEWAVLEPWRICDSCGYAGSHAYRADSLLKYGPSFYMPLSRDLRHSNDFIDISVRVHSSSVPDGAVLVASLERKGKDIFWKGSPFINWYTPGTNEDEWVMIHLSFKLSDMNMRRAGTRLKVYVWNREGQDFLFDDLHIEIRKGNPIIYGLFEKF